MVTARGARHARHRTFRIIGITQQKKIDLHQKKRSPQFRSGIGSLSEHPAPQGAG